MMSKKIQRSMILQYFNDDLYIKIIEVTRTFEWDNNQRATQIKKLLTEFNVPYTPLGSGTNRMAVLIDGYAVKIALDSDGMIDNRREFLYTTILQPYVVKVYECMPGGLVEVCEYVSLFTLDDFHTRQDDMREILGYISNQFLLGDVGVTSKNYTNWGIRSNNEICILDFAYIYDITYKLFVCSCDNSTLVRYDKDFVKLKCPNCGRVYTFGEIRKKVTRAAQEKEIGDIRTKGYNLTSSVQEVEINPEFEISHDTKTKKKDKEKLEKKAGKDNFNERFEELNGISYKEYRKIMKGKM